MYLWLTQWLLPSNIEWLVFRSRYLFCWLLLFLVPGLWGAWHVSSDYQQGEAFRIIFCHVPASVMALICYTVLAICSSIFLVWRIKYYDYLAYCAAETGCFVCGLSLVTGMIWGKPIWGTYWLWDARLTSTAMLFGVYICYHIVRHSIVSRERKRVIAAIIALIGFVDIPIIHYSVYWWNSLHQVSTFFQSSQQTIPFTMSWPIWPMMFGLIGFLGLVGSWRFDAMFLSDQKWRSVMRRVHVS